MEFVAIDVETANVNAASICQIGVVRFKDGLLVEEWTSYVDPQDYFDGINVSLHGIDESVVAGAPTFDKLICTLQAQLENRVVVSHMPFDRVAISQAANRCRLALPSFTWLDTARVARRTWKKFSRSGYGLHNLCDAIGYTFKHHDALEDAKAAAHVLLAAIDHSGLDLNAWLVRVLQPIGPSQTRVSCDGNPDGPFYGEVLVFTGSLNILRGEAADMAASVGCQVDSGVTRRTTILVVGDQDVQRLAGYEKSSKHRKAEELIQKGQAIRIIREGDFRKIAELS